MSINKSHWSAQQERGSLLWIQVLAWISLHCGRIVVRLLLVPISLFYAIFARDAVKHSRNYLRRINPSQSSWWHVWFHIYTFATVSVDRFYFLSGRDGQFSISVEGSEILNEFAQEHRGCLILVSHIGSFEIFRQQASKDNNVELYVLMDVQHNSAAMQVLEQLNPAINERIIDARLNPAYLALVLNEHLQRGHMVGIMADRAGKNEKQINVNFLGGRANFPAGPWLLAHVLKVPVVMMTGVFKGGNRYQVKTQLLADRVEIPRPNRELASRLYIENYSKALESELQHAPYNWFNFYEFWNNDVV